MIYQGIETFGVPIYKLGYDMYNLIVVNINNALLYSDTYT